MAAVVIALPLSACSDDSGGGSQAAPSQQAAAGGAQDLRGVCPETVVVQKDWQPESEHGVLYNLVGPGYKLDTEKKKLTGPLVSEGVDTGVKIEIRTGGPAVGFQPVPALMYTDKAIHLGFVATDEAIQYSLKQPTTSVMAPLEISPLAIMWDKGTHPEFNNIADVGQTDTKVLYTKGLAYMDYLVGSGILRASQLDGSYTGAPDLFIANRGKAALQGFITSEPYIYEKEIKAWGKPLDGQLVNDTGYPSYFDTMAIRSGDKDKLAPCLKKLVPILQKSEVGFLKNPDPAIKIILDAVKKYNTGWQYSEGLAKFSVEQMVKQGIVSNGADKTVGDFNVERLQRMINITKPIFASQHKPVKDGLRPEDVATNEFIDRSIGLGGSGS
ncbi:MAG: ABC transporter substrate-binding protein [Mycobacteriales bacterium]